MTAALLIIIALLVAAAATLLLHVRALQSQVWCLRDERDQADEATAVWRRRARVTADEVVLLTAELEHARRTIAAVVEHGERKVEQLAERRRQRDLEAVPHG